MTIVKAPSGHGSGSTSPWRQVTLLSALLGGVHPGPVQHGRREVDAGGVPHHPREGAHDEAGAAGDVEHGVGGAGAGELHEQPQRRLVVDDGGGGERHRLPRELVEDQLRVSACRHGRPS